jgi:hypothetical protein
LEELEQAEKRQATSPNRIMREFIMRNWFGNIDNQTNIFKKSGLSEFETQTFFLIWPVQAARYQAQMNRDHSPS